MSTYLNLRKHLILVLALLAFLLAAAVLLGGSLHTANVNIDANEAQSVANSDGRITPKPRVRFAALEGKRTPSAQEGRWSPSTLDGRKTPATLDGRKPPAMVGGRRPPVAQATPIRMQSASLSLIDGLILMALAALLLVPTRKTSPLRG